MGQGRDAAVLRATRLHPLRGRVEEQNFSTLIEMINSMEVREDDEEFKNAVDLMFDELKEREPNHFAVRQYAKYKLAAGKTAKSILVSCGARLAVFDIAELREVTAMTSWSWTPWATDGRPCSSL